MIILCGKGQFILKSIKYLLFILFIAFNISILTIIYISNNCIQNTTVNIQNKKIPEEFNGYTIVQISDLHNTEFGKNQSKLIKKIKKENPNAIVITGDLIDKRSQNMENDIDKTVEFTKKINYLAPTYYVIGNHEAQIPKYQRNQLIEKLINSGVVVLANKSVKLTYGKSQINLIGINDVDLYYNKTEDCTNEKDMEILENILSKIKIDEKEFNILISHRPQFLDLYSKYKYDLVFTGHAHGGQIRLPFIGGLIAPEQGAFPKYTDGVHIKENTSMIISRGIGKSKFPFRFLNRPELIVCKLYSK